MTKSNSLNMLTLSMTIYFILIAIAKVSADYGVNSIYSENIIGVVISFFSTFARCEMYYILAVYVLGAELGDFIPEIYTKWRKWREKKNTDNNKNLKEEEEEEEQKEKVPETLQRDYTEILKEVIEYAKGTFQNILPTESIDKLVENIRNFNSGEPYLCVEETKLPAAIKQRELWNFAWNVGTRIYNKETNKMKFRDASAEFIKCSFPIYITEAVSSISCKLKYNDFAID